ncbi:MAG: polysaccharide deacetylase family protein [Oscillospiraceae bacterium]
MKRRRVLTALFPLLCQSALALGIAAVRRAQRSAVKRRGPLPVLMKHAVGDDCWGEESLFVKPEELEKQLQYLSENGYETIFFEDLSHIEQYEKPVLLTFDDGYDDNAETLLPLLRKHGMKATIFLIAGDVGKPHKLTRAQLTELVQSGLVSIQSHGWSHRNMAALVPAGAAVGAGAQPERDLHAHRALPRRAFLSEREQQRPHQKNCQLVLHLRRPHLRRRL